MINPPDRGVERPRLVDKKKREVVSESLPQFTLATADRMAAYYDWVNYFQKVTQAVLILTQRKKTPLGVRDRQIVA